MSDFSERPFFQIWLDSGTVYYLSLFNSGFFFFFDRCFSYSTHLSTLYYTMPRRLSHTDKKKANKMQTSPSCSAPSSPNKMPADASFDESQASQLQKATEVLANISVSQRNRAASASQDSQPITPGQRVRESGSQSQTPQKATEQGLSKITLTEIEDQIQMVERKVVAIAILAEKKAKLTDMLSGAREIPRELRITRELPGLAPGCKYSASTRLQVEELTRSKTAPFYNLSWRILIIMSW